MKNTEFRRYRRAKKTRQKIRELDMPRLSVHISLQHIYAQIFSSDGSKVITSASTLDKEISSRVKSSSLMEAAGIVGEVVAKRAMTVGVNQVGFDRSGFKYHGRVKALAEAARANGLVF